MKQTARGRLRGVKAERGWWRQTARGGGLVVVAVTLLAGGPVQGQTGLRPTAQPREGGAAPESDRHAPSQTAWKYGASAELRNKLHEPSAVGAFPLRRGRVALAVELGWPFYEVRVGVGLHHRVQLELGMRGMWAWTVGGYVGLKIGLVQNSSRSTALSVRVLGGYQHLMNDNGRQFRQLGGGNGGYGEMWLIGSLRRGSSTLQVSGGVRVSQVDTCTRWDLEWEDECPVRPFGANDTGALVTGFLEAGYATRLNANASFFAAIGLDLFVMGGEDWPAMVRLRLGFAVDL